MPKDTNDVEREIEDLEREMQLPNFWSDKGKAQAVLRKLTELKAQKEGLGRYDRGDAFVTIISGAGGDDSEDFARMLLEIYMKYADKQGWHISFIHEHKNDHNGYKNVSFEISGKNVYGMLKNESGVHRLVRISPFNAKKLRHTSFTLVEVIPDFKAHGDDSISLPDKDIRLEFSRSSGPGGQNVN